VESSTGGGIYPVGLPISSTGGGRATETGGTASEEVAGRASGDDPRVSSAAAISPRGDSIMGLGVITGRGFGAGA